MKHPSEATLALHAGGDLGAFASWKVGRHVERCEQCRADLASFEAVRGILPDLADAPEVPWSRLAAEMKANIRLGLSAGECVRPAEPALRDKPLFAGARVAVAFASVVALLVTGLMLERPAPFRQTARIEGVEVQSTEYGIQVREGAETLRILHTGAEAKDVTYTPSAQGSMRARYVDSETGYVTVTNVYAN